MTLHEREEASILHTYKRLPLEIVRGKGMYLYDSHGTEYLDFLGGVAVNALGYGHEGLLSAIIEQSARYVHVSNYFVQQPQIELAELLRHATGFSRVFFCNSGTEANEGALKLIRKWAAAKGRSHVVSMHDSFHGRTMGALSLMTNADYREGFGPFLNDCVHVPFNDTLALRSAVNGSTAAVVLEFIQGEGGINEVSSGFAEQLQILRQELGFLVIADEVQSGLGRTGKFLACDHYGFKPDIVTLAKPLGGGLPLGAILVSDELKDVLQPGNHGTTFGGNPVACAAGIVVVNEIAATLQENARSVGSYLIERMKRVQDEMPAHIKSVRGRGLMVGVELSFPGKAVVDALLQRKIIVNCTHTNVLRFVPPLIVENAHVDEVCNALHSVLGTFPVGE